MPDDERYNTKKEYFNVQMFSSKIEISTLRVIIGLKKDYETRTEKINLKPMKGVYFPIDSFYNCDSLPLTWLELFNARTDKDETLEEVSDMYPINSIL